MIKRLLLIVLYLSTTYDVVAQSKMNFSLARKVHDKESQRDEVVSMLIQGDVEQIEMLVKEVGGHFKYSAGNIVSVSLSINQLSRIISNSSIKRVEAFPPKVQPLSDTVLCNNTVLPVHYGQAPLPQGYDGAGVIIGFIDFGIDFTHPDFKDSLGKSRILWLWDQSKANAANTPMPYNYGQEWSNTDIDNGLCTHNPSAAGGHGTVVAGIAAGNGLATGGFLGTAPKANIVAVYVSNSVSDAAAYIYSKALAAGKPCVINASVGRDYGLHDGKDLESQAIDNLINAKPGRSFVAAAGDRGIGGNIPGALHLAYTTSLVDTNFTFFSPVSGIVYMGIVADSNSLKNIQFAFGADKMLPSHSFRGNIPFANVASMPIQTVVTTTLMAGGNRIGIVQSYLDTVAGDYNLEYYIQADSTSYYWRLMATGTGSFDSWNYTTSNPPNYTPIINSGLPSSTTMPDSIYYKFPDTDKTLQGSFQCLNSVITVTSYVNRKSYTDCNSNSQLLGVIPGSYDNSSSIGPTRDGRTKPEIASPGDIVFGAAETQYRAGAAHSLLGKGCYHRIGYATSCASPGVAGIAALYLQKNPTATAAQVKQAIINSAYQDQFTGNGLPNKYWGYGKVNALTALTGSLTISHPSDTTVCENDSTVFIVRYNGTGLTYQWQVNQGYGFINLSNTTPYIGVTNDSLIITSTPYSFNNYKYRCIINNCTTCVKLFDSATLTVNPAPGIITSATADSVCFSSNSQTSPLKYSTTSNTPATYSIIWNATALLHGFSTVTNAALSASPISIAIPANAMTTTYSGTVTIKTTQGCSSIIGNSFSVTIDSLPLAIAGNNSTICSDSVITVSGAIVKYGGINWTENGAGGITSGGATVSPTYTAAPTDEGNIVTLTMTVTNTNACGIKNATAFYTIKVDSLPVATGGGMATICSDSTITISSVTAKNGSILWTKNGTGSIISGANTINPVYAANINDGGNTVLLTMIVTSTNACTPQKAVTTYTLHVNSLPIVNISGLAPSYCYNASAKTLSGSPSGGLYSGTGITDAVKGVFNPVIAGAGTYTITYTYGNNNSCVNTASISTIVLPQPTGTDSCYTATSISPVTPFEPSDSVTANVFTPNDDGINDIFMPNIKTSTLTNSGSYSMNIYNRWGEFIYVSNSQNIGWDGTSMAGVKLPPGTYYYTISVNGNKYKGFVSLIR